jgi:hypothetical protein
MSHPAESTAAAYLTSQLLKSLLVNVKFTVTLFPLAMKTFSKPLS